MKKLSALITLAALLAVGCEQGTSQPQSATETPVAPADAAKEVAAENKSPNGKAGTYEAAKPVLPEGSSEVAPDTSKPAESAPPQQ